MPPRDRARAELYDRARRLRWTLAGASVAAFGALAGLVVSNPIGTQAQAASAAPPAATEPQSDDQPPVQQPRSAPPPVSNAGQQPPILRTRRS
jgi:hypothetical protein